MQQLRDVLANAENVLRGAKLTVAEAEAGEGLLLNIESAETVDTEELQYGRLVIDATLTVSAEGDTPAKVLDDLAAAHNALMADRSLGGIVESLDWLDYEAAGEEGVLTGTATYTARFTRID